MLVGCMQSCLEFEVPQGSRGLGAQERDRFFVGGGEGLPGS